MTENPNNGREPQLSAALQASRERAVRRAAKGDGQQKDRHPLGPSWLWALALLGNGAVVGVVVLTILLGLPWACRADAAQGFLVICLPLALIFGVLGALSLEGLRHRAVELHELRAYRERTPGVITHSEFVERQLSQGGYTRYLEIEYDFEVRGKVRSATEKTYGPSFWAKRQLLGRYAPGAAVQLRRIPGEPGTVRLLFPGWPTYTWLGLRVLAVLALGGLLGAVAFAVLAAFTGT